MGIINVKNVVRSFKQYKKAPGLKGTLKSIFKREHFNTIAVNNISFNIQEGEIVGFLGPNGAGKTTTLKMLSGILHPSEGQITVAGFNPQKRDKEFLKTISLVMGQKTQLLPDLPPMEYFLLMKEIYEIKESDFKSKIEELAELLDVKEVLNIPVRKLSLGQKMKCEIIASILHNPRILFLDEPTIGLDIVVQKKLRDFLKEYNRKFKTTIILTSHYMEDVEALCSRIIVINKGTLIYDGNLEQLVRTHATHKEVRIELTNVVSEDSITKFGEVVENIDNKIFKIKIEQDNLSKKISQLLFENEVVDIDVNEISLDDVIRSIFSS